MIVATDGKALLTGGRPGMGRLILRVAVRHTAKSLVGSLMLALAGIAMDVQGQTPPLGVRVAPATVVLANQAMRLEVAPVAEEPSPMRLVSANQPAKLSLEEKDGLRSPVSSSSVAYASGDGVPAGSPVLAGEFGGDEPSVAPPKVARTSEDRLVASVSVESERARRLMVPKDGAVTINLKVPVERVELRDSAIADVVQPTPQRIIVAGKAFGSTQLVLYAKNEQSVFNIFVERNLDELNDMIRATAPSSNIQVRSLNGTIVLRGTVPDSATAQSVVELASLAQGGEIRNQLQVAGVQQTLLRVVVAEVNREAIRELGVNWAIGGSDWSRDIFFANNIGQINPTQFTSSGVTNVLNGNHQGGQLTYALSPVGNGPATNVTIGFPRAEYQMFINALRQNNLSRVLAEPNLVAISGQTARFLAGGEVPIPVPQGGSAAGAITIEYHEFGVRLGFTPTVSAGQIIRLHVMTEVSEATPGQQLIGGFPIFTFNTRRVESTVECGNGQTFAIAGLLNDRIRATASKIPGLGDLPVLGTLFSSTEYQKSNTELVVLVTPQLVEPLDPQMVPPVPGQLMRPPSDFELFGLGMLEGQAAAAPETEGVPREHAPVNVRPYEVPSWPSTQTALRGPWGMADGTEAD